MGMFAPCRLFNTFFKQSIKAKKWWQCVLCVLCVCCSPCSPWVCSSSPSSPSRSSSTTNSPRSLETMQYVPVSHHHVETAEAVCAANPLISCWRWQHVCHSQSCALCFQVAMQFITLYGYDDVVTAMIEGSSGSVWRISPPSRHEVIKELLESPVDVTLRLAWNFQRLQLFLLFQIQLRLWLLSKRVEVRVQTLIYCPLIL